MGMRSILYAFNSSASQNSQCKNKNTKNWEKYGKVWESRKSTKSTKGLIFFHYGKMLENKKESGLLIMDLWYKQTSQEL